MGNLVDVISISETARRVVEQVETVIVGKRSAVELALVALLSGGHVLIEDIPGVGKTTLAKSLAKALGCSFKRIQFTPDLLPADITGTFVFNQKMSTFEFHEGPIFASIVLADEINRATPKTQSALLEAMEESQITVDGVTRQLPSPFFVIATENDIEAQGTYALPEAQLDRFMVRLSIGYPSKEDEAAILAKQTRRTGLSQIEPALTQEELIDMQILVREVYVDRKLYHYIVEIVDAIRNHASVTLGPSPRASLSLLHCSQSYAALHGRTFVLPDDIRALAPVVLSHRIILRAEARIKSITTSAVLRDVIASTPVPIVENAR